MSVCFSVNVLSVGNLQRQFANKVYVYCFLSLMFRDPVNFLSLMSYSFQLTISFVFCALQSHFSAFQNMFGTLHLFFIDFD